MELMKKGDLEAAAKKFSEAVAITSFVKYSMVKAIKELNIPYIIAPHEADSQLAYLYHSGKAQLVITEDSDLIAFGVKKLLFKLNNEGVGQEIDMNNLKYVTGLDFSKFTQDMILTTCILSGCDYLKSIKGVGFKTAQKLVAEHITIKQTLRAISQKEKYTVPSDYELNFE